MEVHLLFDKNISLYEAHKHATDIEIEIRNQFGNTIITTHLEPNE
ncbi:MAG: cation transporter dimerization domain-containing protein [Proteocatella sp.]